MSEGDKLVAVVGARWENAWTENSKWIDETVEKLRFRCEVVREGLGKGWLGWGEQRKGGHSILALA